MKKIVALTLTAGMLLACATGCVGTGTQGGGTGTGIYNQPGTGKTEIKVINFNGGIGSVWIEEAAERFAKLKQEESYASGKKGVYISIDKSMALSTSSMGSAAYNIYFDERLSDVNSLAQAGLLLPITDIVKDETREGGSLESKLFPQVKESLQGNDGEYYSLPHYEFYGGIAYNYDTFAKELAFFAADDEQNKWEYESTKYGNAYFVKSLDAKKSAGPDGEYGNEDDGLPCSLEEMIILMDYIKQESDGYAPIVVSGDYTNYINYTICGLWSALAGYEQMTNYYNCEGEIEVIDYTHKDGPFTNEPLFTGIDYIKKPRTKKITLTEETGYLGNDMVAKYYAFALLEIMEKEGFYSEDSYIGTRNQYDAHMNIYMDGQGVYEKTAMLIEASYWCNESKKGGAFAAYERFHGKKAADLDLRFMALPTSCYTEDNTGGKSCLVDIGQSFAMINGNIASNPELKRASKEFLAFLYSEEELQNFTICTGMPRAFNYKLSSEQKGQMGSYYTRMWELRDSEAGSNVVYLSGTTPTFKKVKNSIKLELSAPILIPNNQGSAFAYFRGRAKNPDGTYAMGTKDVFEVLRLTVTQWNAISK